MIKVIIKQKNNNIIDFEISGHAGSAELGNDLICAAVSTISTGVLNTLDYKGFIKDDICRYEIRDGYVKIEVVNSNNDIQVILETLEITLKTIEESSINYIKISKVEV